ncbi:unnamed protein product [Arctia plantaginis]|uniref:Uncharacterized protein n=1 Tax=Arctia plantaginis TaxID=874455 RepID=A0A8S1ANK6_ARCPL|nr:unnamed protein product [Arctia plantaginis]
MLVELLTSLFNIIIILAALYVITTSSIFVYIKLKFEPVKGVCKSNVRLDGKVALVTGGNQGIGLETARDLASRGAKIIIACRDGKKSADAIADIIKTTGNNNIEYKYLDLSSFRSVRSFADDFNQTYDRLDILINNAGCAGLKHKASEDGIDLVMQVNYLGPFLLTNLLLDKIKASPAGRIVIVSSLLHLFGRVTTSNLNGLQTKHYMRKYANSKLCDILWTRALAKRLPKNVLVNSLHPGVVKTDIFKRLDRYSLKWLMFLIEVLNFKTPKEGAQTSIYLAVSEEVDNISGKYFMECKEAEYSKVADSEDLVEDIWNKSVMLTS